MVQEKNYFFYHEYYSQFGTQKNVRKGGFVCYVVGNRTSGGQYMRLDLFTNGFSKMRILV